MGARSASRAVGATQPSASGAPGGQARRLDTPKRCPELFRENFKFYDGIGGRDRDRSVEWSAALVGLDELASLRFGNPGHHELEPRAFEDRRSFAPGLGIDEPLHADFDMFE